MTTIADARQNFRSGSSRERSGEWRAFSAFADAKLLRTQKTVLALAAGFEGEGFSRTCRGIAETTGQDASTVRKTLAFFRKVGWMECGTKQAPRAPTRLTEFGKRMAAAFKDNGNRGDGNGE
ncbi:MAG: hypothetical protein NTY90_05235 [Candidatus Micrarchaeota archaeon]|nr:hypothetical protein [Candidatus Micrarchaeota archaeon]